PPVTVDGETEMPIRAALPVWPAAGGFTVIVVETEFAPVAVTVACVAAGTEEVDTRKIAVAWPSGTVTEVGTATAGSLLARPICTPPAGAGAESARVPVAASPPRTSEGETVRLAIVPAEPPVEPVPPEAG